MGALSPQYSRTGANSESGELGGGRRVWSLASTSEPYCCRPDVVYNTALERLAHAVVTRGILLLRLLNELLATKGKRGVQRWQISTWGRLGRKFSKIV